MLFIKYISFDLAGQKAGWFDVAFRSSEVDTVVNNAWMVQMALQEALINARLGFQYQYVPQRAITDTEGVIHPSMIRDKFHPDIVINLKSLSLTMSGDTHHGMTDIEVKPRIVNDALYSYTEGLSSYYGNILMDYTAVWDIRDIKAHTSRSVSQEGRYVSKYYDDYSMNDEVMICAKKIGKDFSALFENSYRHNF